MSSYISLNGSDGLEVRPANPTMDALTRPIDDEPVVLPSPIARVQYDVSITGAIVDTIA
jgi:hypothetical protein